MSHAFKCDRCGRFYVHSHYDGVITVSNTAQTTAYPKNFTYDLCPDCFDYLMKYLNALKKPAVQEEEK